MKNGKIAARSRARVLDSGAYPKALDLAWCTWVMSTGPYEIPNLDYDGRGRLHQHDGQRRLSRRRPARKRPSIWSGSWTWWPTRPVSTRPRCAASTSSRRTSSPTRPSPASSYDTGEYEKALDRALELVGYDKLRAEQAEAAQAGPLPRHRPRVLRRDLRLRPVGELDRAGRAGRRGHDLHRHLAARPGPGDDLRPARRRLSSAPISIRSRSTTATPATPPRATAPGAAAVWPSAARRW